MVLTRYNNDNDNDDDNDANDDNDGNDENDHNNDVDDDNRHLFAVVYTIEGISYYCQLL